LLSFLIVFGGFAFNVGNIAGAALGLNVLTGVDIRLGAVVSAAIAVALFQLRQAGRAMDAFAKFLGLVMIALIVYVVIASRPPLADALVRSFLPEQIDAAAIVTIVGGTVGGYISFAGAHRLLDAGVTGAGALPAVTQGAVRGLLLTGVIRVLLFLAALGVVASGGAIDAANPPASVFQNAAGEIGYRLFGVMMWSAAITSVVGAAYTSVSFLKSVHPVVEREAPRVTAGFILISLTVFLTVGQPVRLLVLAGMLNGLILPLALGVVLVAARRYAQPAWLQAAGWLVVVIMGFMGVRTLGN
jgi:Mn2+/Fe2+ NRAMP family transporter